MAVPELMGIANELGIKVKQDDSLETVVYAILDKAAENSATGDETPKKKRTRIQKKDTSRVYTVTGQDGENLDSIKKRKPVEAPSLFSEKAKAKEEASVATEKNPSEEAPAEEKPKRRGRKSKAELAAETEAADAAQKEAEAEIPATPEFEAPVESTPDFVPEEAYFSDNTEEAGEEQLQMMEQLKQKLERGHEYHVSEETEISEEGVWDGDPGDGTDFITVLDIPIEDQAAIPTLDIFDRPDLAAR